MKKIYISPNMLVVRIAASQSMLSGSLNIDGDSGSATFNDENAYDDAMARDYEVNDYDPWDQTW